MISKIWLTTLPLDGATIDGAGLDAGELDSLRARLGPRH